jgi:hypothetical protein
VLKMNVKITVNHTADEVSALPNVAHLIWLIRLLFPSIYADILL